MINRRIFGLSALALAANQSSESTARPSVNASAKADTILVSFATNRNRTNDAAMFGSYFRSDDRSLCYTGTVNVVYDAAGNRYVADCRSIRIDELSEAGADTLQPVAKASSIATRSSSAIERFIADGAGTRSGRDGIETSKLFFVHGFNNTFCDAVTASAKMAREYGIAKTACFSWPSYGSLFRYKDDQDHAMDSGVALSKVVGKILEVADRTSTPARTLDLVCHSMGAQVLSAALATLQGKKVAALVARQYFGHTILAAPNERADALSRSDRLALAIRLSNAVFVYSNVKDKVLNFSSEIINHRTELGQFGPIDFDQLPKNVSWVDCTDAADNGFLQTGHGYFLNEDTVVNDIRSVIGDAQPAFRKRILR